MNHSDHDALDADEVAVCPACGSTQLQIHASSRSSDRKRYRCWDCSARFDAFDRRSRKRDAKPRHGLAADLLQTNADDL